MKTVLSHQILICSALLVTTLSPCATFAQAKAGVAPGGSNQPVAMCKANDVSLATDNENGSFDGMSHSGTLLVLRNLSPAACRVPQRPEVKLLDKAGKPLAVTLEIAGAKFMHPGPALVPVVVAPDAEITSKLRYVSGEVYDQSVCADAATLTVMLEGGTQRTPMAAHLCGDKAKGVTYEATPFAVDPQYKK